MTAHTIKEQRTNRNENLKQFLLSVAGEPEPSKAYGMTEILERLEAEGIFDARPTIVREFDDIVNPHRGEKGSDKARYREYGTADLAMLKLFLALRILGFTKRQIARFWEQYSRLVTEMVEIIPRKYVPYISGPLDKLVDVTKPEVAERLSRWKNYLEDISRFQREVDGRVKQLQGLLGKTQGWLSNFATPWAAHIEELQRLGEKGAKSKRDKRV